MDQGSAGRQLVYGAPALLTDGRLHQSSRRYIGQIDGFYKWFQSSTPAYHRLILHVHFLFGVGRILPWLGDEIKKEQLHSIYTCLKTTTG